MPILSSPKAAKQAREKFERTRILVATADLIPRNSVEKRETVSGVGRASTKDAIKMVMKNRDNFSLLVLKIARVAKIKETVPAYMFTFA